MPQNTVYVGRPSRWGNPFKPNEYENIEDCLKDYRERIERIVDVQPDFLEPLVGKDLACWCSLDKPCHADVLLEILNPNKTLVDIITELLAKAEQNSILIMFCKELEASEDDNELEWFCNNQCSFHKLPLELYCFPLSVKDA